MIIAPLLTISAVTTLLLIPAALGTILLAAARLLPEKVTRLLAGTLLGWALLALCAHLAGALLGASPLLTAALAAAMTVAIIRLFPRARPLLAVARWDTTALLLFLLLFAVLAGAGQRLLVAEEGGWTTYALNAYADLGFHAASITSLVHNGSLIPDNPIFAGRPLVYPFMANRFSALLVASGATLPQAITLPALVLIPLALTLLYRFALAINDSKPAAVIAVLLVLLGGSSLGWLEAGQDFRSDYTGHSTSQQGYYLTNPLISMFLPQRAFLFGLPLALVMLLLLQQGLQEKRRRTAFIAAGLVAGVLPLFHAHSALAAGVLILAWIAARPGRHWLVFIGAAAAAGLPAILYYAAGDAAGSVLPRLQLWWMAHDTNPLAFWFKNSGLLVPLTLLGLFLPAPRAAKIAAAAGLALFAAANIWLFAPWEWDNTKLFIYWLIFTAPLLGWLLFSPLQLRRQLPLRAGLLAASALFFIAHTAAGALDVGKLVLPGGPSYIIWDAAAVDAAASIRQHTPPGAVIVTAPIHNAPAALAGRAVYLGFPGHVWSHGGNYIEREAALREFYQGRRGGLPELAPNYVLVGPVERQMFDPIVIQPQWELLADTGPYQLYKLPVTGYEPLPLPPPLQNIFQ